ncbi:NAD(P)-binding protein [Aspergillus pseudonomiae]|uniref:NAD dependent epimerase/dehydratase family protein n=2 Tax=Aspergillus subgen. Circumdati TaxID=2720871 RepID=A0A0L1IKB4_ASPN3|nr:NAD dependent epimerase/dehydratase family protein [Aspergillus nomiae NRRL 13137]XP_031935251.1 NAD(P)-binding protein [Aspergillus pseudonomiae]KAB8254524.1 NAD(P)-binding protein [Aspergillus pseudonomiae]KAE8397932.1 NAD(P)-binding protein [Aspergillus pseudonomiae]KNG80004.1 NAD dependent epimerase/dehydratase family protein [Aspergillus nomiae NRRL 13137]
MQVLLLGGHGKIALHLTPLLLNRGWNVTSVIRNPDHENEILARGKGTKGKLNVLLSSLDDIKSDEDAKKIIDTVSPDYVVWSAGAGGKGGPERTFAIDERAAKHFISASFASPRVTKFLLVSWLGSRRVRPSWMSDEGWEAIQNVFYNVLPAYAKAKLEADEYLTAFAARRKQSQSSPFQAICLRPGTLTDEPATGKVQFGKTEGRGNVTREDVAIVADRLLARSDTNGWYDLINGDEPIDDAVERAVREKVDVVEGEDVDAMVKRFFP